MRNFIILLFIVCFSTSNAVNIPVDIYQDMENGSNGATVTSAIAGNGSHGTGGSWSVTGTAVKVATAGEHALPAPVVVNGTSYTDVGSTRGWSWSDLPDQQYVTYDTPAAQSVLVLSAFLTIGPPDGLFELYDMMQCGAGLTYSIVQLSSGDDGELGLWLETWTGSTDHSAQIPVTQGQTYWVTMKANASSGTANMAVYEIAGWTQIGSVSVGMTTGTMSRCRIGRTDSHGNSSATTSYADDFCINWTDTTFPFLPSSTGGIPVTQLATANWIGAGVPGGIPTRNDIHQTLSQGATGGQITTAVNNCPAGKVIFLSAGTYNISPIDFGDPGPMNCTLRGAGMGQTILNFSSGSAALNTGSYAPWFGSWVNSTNITAGGTQTSTTVTVASAASYVAGDMCVIDMVNADWIQGEGQGGTNADSVGKNRDGVRAQFHFCRIVSKSGNNLTFDPPLPFALESARTPQFSRHSIRGGPVNFGIEDLTVQTTGSNTQGIFINGSYACWLKNIELKNWGAFGVHLRWNLHFEMRGCYIHDPNTYSVDHGYGLMLNPVSSCLIEDNIIYNCQSTILLQGGCTGNVLAYNVFAFGKYVNGGYTGEWLQHEISGNHSPFPAFNLFEGNYTGQFQSDYYYGPSGWGTIFRNRIPGNSSATTEDERRIAVSIDAKNRNYAVVGNQLGERTAPNSIYLALPDVTRNYAQPGTITWSYDPGSTNFTTPHIYRLGYPYSGNNSTGSGLAVHDNIVKTGTIRHGNWDAQRNAVYWDPLISDHTLPNSFYRSVKPAFFNTLTWPPYGPSAPTSVSSDLTKIPAGLRLVAGLDPEDPAPTLASIAPHPVSGRSYNQEFTLTGANFEGGTRVQISNSHNGNVFTDTILDPVFNDPDLTVQFIATLVDPGSDNDVSGQTEDWFVRVVNSDDQVSNQLTLTVIQPGISPAPSSTPISEIVGQRVSSTEFNAIDSGSAPFPAPVTVNNLIVVTGAMWKSAAPTSVAVSDTRGTVYSYLYGSITQSSYRTFIAWGIVPQTGTCTVTVNPQGTTGDFSWSMNEYSGARITNPIDVNGGESTGSTGTTAGAAQDGITPSAGALVVGVMTHGGSTRALSASSGYTTVGEVENNVTCQAHHSVFKILTDAQAVTVGVQYAAGDSATWKMQTASFAPNNPAFFSVTPPEDIPPGSEISFASGAVNLLPALKSPYRESYVVPPGILQVTSAQFIESYNTPFYSPDEAPQIAAAAESDSPELVAPTLLSATVEPIGDILTLLFDEPVTTRDFEDGIDITTDGDATTATYSAGDGESSVTLSLDARVAPGDTLTLDYTPGDIRDFNGNALSDIVAFDITNNSVADFTVPTLTSATVDATGDSLALIFSEAVSGDLNSGLTLDTDGTPAEAEYASGFGTDTILYTLSETVAGADSLTLDYTQGTIQDLSENLLANIVDHAVTNNSEV